MKRQIYFISLCLFMIILSACNSKSSTLDNMTTESNDDYVSITWQGRTYVPFCAIDNDERGVQIGIVNGDKNDQVYEYKGYSSDEWIISFYKSGEMDSSMLMKEVNVKQIPNNLQSDYDWNNE